MRGATGTGNEADKIFEEDVGWAVTMRFKRRSVCGEVTLGRPHLGRDEKSPVSLKRFNVICTACRETRSCLAIVACFKPESAKATICARVVSLNSIEENE